MESFRECSICAAKPGSPDLCSSCFQNRVIISQLELRIKDLEDEIKIDDTLIKDRNRVLHAIPTCEAHGNECVSHAVEWVERVKTLGEVIAAVKRIEK